MGGVATQLELLAPAGDETCLRAAVANGADAVYLGLEDFNARRRAGNFTLAGLQETMRWLHGRNVKGYIAFNTLVFADELERATDYVRGIIEAGADAIIVQDLGLARLIRQMSPSLPIHASTQMTQTHSAGLVLLRNLGINRVILARELSIAEIRQIATDQVMELEVFVHGALCVSYSGQCLASESLWGRSGNRGVCGQACRLPYELIVDGEPSPQERGAHILSPYDLAAYDRIDELVQAGVSAFKIEGRLKNADYVALNTHIYRKAIDAALEGKQFVLSSEQRRGLRQTFSRGFTHGFLDGDHHQELIGASSPRSRGVFLGTVDKRANEGIVIAGPIETCDTIKPGDGVVFTSDDEQDAQGGRVYSVSRRHGLQPAEGHALYELRFGRGDLVLSRIAIGSQVFKTDDPTTRRRIESSYVRDQVARRVPVRASVRVAVGERMLLILDDNCGHHVQVWSDQVLRKAEKHPVTLEMLREQLTRLGDTPFVLVGVTLSGSAAGVEPLPVMVPKSLLNGMRRRAAQELMELRERASKHPIMDAHALNTLRTEVNATYHREKSQPLSLTVLARDIHQYHAACDSVANENGNVRISCVYADFATPESWAAAADAARCHNVAFGLATPHVLKPGEESILDAAADLHPDVWLVRNLATLRCILERNQAATCVADFSLNTANDITAAVLTECGAARITPGYDLNVRQWATLCAAASGIQFELIAHAHVPMFHMAHCIAAAGLSKGNDCRDCGRPCSRHSLHLRDRNGENHPVRVGIAGRTTVFNSRPQSIVVCRKRLADLTVCHWRVELLGEDGATTRQLLRLYRQLLGGDVTVKKELRRIVPGMLAGTLEHA